jgi:hypothetical protein
MGAAGKQEGHMEQAGTIAWPVACNVGALTAEEQQLHGVNIKKLFDHAVVAVEQLADGYVFRFAPDEFVAVAAFVERERRCCPFFRFAISLDAHDGPLWLSMSGNAEAQAVLRGFVASTKD